VQPDSSGHDVQDRCVRLEGRRFDREAAARARPETIGDAADALQLPVASAEDIVLAKLEWFKLGGETSERS
jgi:hypothetical protein